MFSLQDRDDTTLANEDNLHVASYSLENLLPNSLFSTPAVSIRLYEPVIGAAYLLSHFIESFTDSLVVTKHDEPIGIVGGMELLDGIMKNPTSKFFDDVWVKEIMNKNLSITTKQTKLSDLLKKWRQTRRAFSIIPNPYHGYSVISARKLLEIGTSCGTKTKVSDIPRKRVVTFNKDYTVRKIIKSMFENKTRKLVLEGTSMFISDRIIIEKIARQLNCLRGVDNFLEMKADIFQLDKAEEVPHLLTLKEACKILYEMQSPYLMIDGQVISPWDIVMILDLENLEN